MNLEEIFININSLPKELSSEETKELIKQYNNGCLDAKESLIIHNIRLVLYEVYNKFSTVKYDKKELVSIGNIGLIKAINTYDLSKKIHFSTYAAKCIDNEIYMFLRKIKKHQIEESLDKTIYNERENEIKLKDTIADNSDFVNNMIEKEEKLILYKKIREEIEKLPNLNKKICEAYYGFSNDKMYTQEELANIFHISRSYVSTILIRSRKVIQAALEREGFIQVEDKESKKNKTIYQYFHNYTKEEVDNMLLKLDEDELSLVKIRYGNNLNIPIKTAIDDKQYKKYYSTLVPKMKKILNENQVLEKMKIYINRIRS